MAIPPESPPATDAVVRGLPEWLPTWLETTWVLLSVHPLVLFTAIILGGLILGYATRFMLLFWGLRLAARTPWEIDGHLVRLVARVTATLIIMLSLIAAVQSLPLGERVGQVLVRILASVLVLQLMQAGMRAGKLALDVLGKVRDRFQIVEERTIPLFDLVLTVLVVGLAAYALLMVWNINPTAWLASAGVIGIAVGFAARDTLANLFAGFFIIADAPYKLGDYVVLDTGDRGEVTRVGIRSTRLLTRDDVEITVPNSEMANAKIFNESGGRWVKFRIRIKVGVAYGSDVDQVVEVLQGVADGHDAVCREPAARVRMRGFGDSSLDFELLCWVNHPSERGLVTHDLYMKIYKRLNETGIEIPFPQRDLWVRTPVRLDDGNQDSPPGSA